MTFIDEITLNIYSGKGGDGVVSWMHTKGIDHAGPGGGNGGRGGDVYLKGVRDIGRLLEYRFMKDFKAQNGENGKGDCMHGKKGDDLILELPLGSVLKNTETGEETEVLSEKPIFFLKGGNGGYGNEHFKGSKNRRPKEFTKGKNAEGGTYFVELKLMVDIGLVGFPNAGKSSLLNSITHSKAKVGDYQFTTLEPNLGSFYGFVIADIPGLIEGASEGKGLGDKFLRHISRTKMILHCISCEYNDPEAKYDTIRAELAAYDPELSKKPEILLLTKADMVDSKILKARKKLFEKKKMTVLDVSVIDDDSVKKLANELVKLLKKL
jgi:GTP-binding protein